MRLLLIIVTSSLFTILIVCGLGITPFFKQVAPKTDENNLHPIEIDINDYNRSSNENFDVSRFMNDTTLK